MGRESANVLLDTILAKAGGGVRDALRFHDLRHTFRTWGAEAGVPLEVMMAQLGHMDRETSLENVHIQQLGPHSNQRMELVFLDHCFRWVITEGVLVFVIPVTALGACARLLASQFERIGMFRLEHPEYARFKQIVVFGKRNPMRAAMRTALMRWCAPASI